MAKFFVHPRYDGQEFLGVIINKKRINLLGKDHKQLIPKSSKGPAHEITWKGATEKDLEAYYNLGNQKVVYKEEATNAKSSPGASDKQ